ncbi:ATP-binding cassette domain-containing protein [Pseudarthrobacter sp. So.54]
MSLIRLQDVSVRYDNTQILREAFFRLEAGDRVGLIGKNGSGKTTILKLVLDQVQPDTGVVTVEQGTKVGYFSQFSELNGDATILEVLDALFSGIKAVEAELAAIDVSIAAGPADAELDRLIEPAGRVVRGHGTARRLGLPAPHRHRSHHPGLRRRTPPVRD